MQNSNFGVLENNYKIDNDQLSQGFGISLVLSIFLILFFPNYLGYWAAGLLIINVIYMVLKDKLLITFPAVTWGIFSIISAVGILYAPTSSPTQYYYVVYLFNMLLTYVNLSSHKIRISVIYKLLFSVTLIFFIGSIIQIISPSTLLSINRFHLSDQLYSESANFISRKLISGLTHQTGINGYVLSVLSSFLIIEYFKKDRPFVKFLYIALFVINIFFIFMTGKRSFILFNALIVFVLIPFLSKYKYTVPITIVAFLSILAFILFDTQIGEDIFIKMAQDDISSGRFNLNSTMWNDVKESPLFGLGTYTTMDSLFGTMNGHNIYLQVLRENGLLGFIPFIIFVIYNLILSLRLLLKNNSTYRYYLIFSIYNQLLFILWGFTGNPLYDTYPLLVYIISVGILLRYKINQSTSERGIL